MSVVDAGDAGPPAATPARTEGEYRLADEVVATIAGLAAAAVPGVTAMGGGPGLDLGEVLGKRHGARGVRVELGTRQAALDVYLHVAYGARIPTVAHRVQESVKLAVESMTGLRVVEVNVHVQGVDAAPARGRPGALDPPDSAPPSTRE